MTIHAQELATTTATAPQKQYQFANILSPRPNISIRRTPQEIRVEILAWIFAAVCLALVAWGTYTAAMDWLGK